MGRSQSEMSDQLSTSRSRAVRLDSFGGPEVLDILDVPAPQAGPGQVRVRVTAAGLNPMDWFMLTDADTAVRFGLSLPAGFGTDYAGVVDQVGDGVTGFASGDRVFGGALSRAVADFVVVDPTGGIAANEAHHIPDGVDDRTAATLTIAGRTASAALAVVELGPEAAVLLLRSTSMGRRQRTPQGHSASLTRASPPSPRRSRASHQPTAPTPAQAPWKSSLA
jgi:NADPH:quinone reductase-like Zn-dependent oxidoreductase